jgi:hypothetical protein
MQDPRSRRRDRARVSRFIAVVEDDEWDAEKYYHQYSDRDSGRVRVVGASKWRVRRDGWVVVKCRRWRSYGRVDKESDRMVRSAGKVCEALANGWRC